jgi:hypothetical protein
VKNVMNRRIVGRRQNGDIWKQRERERERE